MHGLIRPASLRYRIMTWAEREAAQDRLHPHAGRLIAEVVIAGSVSRTDAVDILRLTGRYGREQIRILIQQGLVIAGEREPLRPAFPLKTVPWWFPGLFPGDVEQRLDQGWPEPGWRTAQVMRACSFREPRRIRTESTAWPTWTVSYASHPPAAQEAFMGSSDIVATWPCAVVPGR